MMKSKLAKAVSLLVAIQAGALHALGLGEISVSSAVNERFVAEIPIANARGLDQSQILVSLASSSDFLRADIERAYYLSRLDFDVDTSNGVKVLRVSTNDVVLEPYLNFLLEVRWPNGRLLKEYMVLLDLPAYTTAPAKAVDAPTPDGRDQGDNTGSNMQSGQRSTKTLPSSKASTTNTSATRKRAAVDASAVASGSYTVQANQTLWDIGKASRATDETITQAMNRVYQANPTAFVNGDINRLINGAVLRIPATLAQVSQQSNTRVTTHDSGLAALKDASQSLTDTAQEQPVNQQPSDNGLLTLSAADVSQGDQIAGNASANGATETSEMESETNDMQPVQSQYSSSADIAQLENDLARSFESLDRAKLENAGLERRVEGIQQQFTDLERLIALKDQELAALRDSLTQGADASDAATVLAASTQIGASETPVNTTESGSIIDKLASALSLTSAAFLMLIGTVVALLIALGWWLLSRKDDDQYQASIFEPAESLHEFEQELKAEPEPLVKVTTEAGFSVDTQTSDPDTSTSQQAPSAPLADTLLDEAPFEETAFESTVLDDEAEPLLANTDPVADELLVEELIDFNAPLEFDVSAEVDPLADETLDELDKLGLSLDLDADVNVNAVSEEADTDVGLQLAYDADAVESLAPADAPQDASDSSSFASEVGTKLDLARAYIDMGDFDGAREILDEVLQEGSDLQRTQATEMLTRIA